MSSSARPQNNNNVAIQEPWQYDHHPQRGQLLRSPSRSSRARTRATSSSSVSTITTTWICGQPEYGSAGGTSYPTSFGHDDATRTRSASARHAVVGAGPLPRARARCQRAVQLVRPGAVRLERPGHADDAADGPESDHHGARRRQYVVLPPRRGLRHFQPAFPGEPATPTNLVAGPAQLLRHVIGVAQRRGRRGADGSAGPQPHAHRDPRGADRLGRDASR